MTLPWFLNPWAEVRRLRDKVRLIRGAEQLAWATADRAIAERNAATGTAAIDVHFEKFDVRKAFPTHPDFGEVIRMVPAEELERAHTENADLRRRIAEMEEAIGNYQDARDDCEMGCISRTGNSERKAKYEARKMLFALIKKQQPDPDTEAVYD